MANISDLNFWNDWTFFSVYSGVGRLLLSVIVLIVGFLAAKHITNFVRKMTRSFFAKKEIADSPVGSIFESTNALKGSGVLSAFLYWFVVFFFISIAGELLGITFFTSIVSLLVGYIPAMLSALIVFVFGVVVSGVVEKVVKQQFKRLAPQQAVLAGSLASYVSISIFVLIALSELGIASDFIIILFAGFVFATALALGIAFGFGAKDLVAETLSAMVHDEKKIRSKK